jgi:predicted component of type VI protein secretion system
MCSNRRDRLVIFRLSQDEYQKLKDASERQGARNLSDFTRGEVLSVLNSRANGNHIEQSFSSMEQSMAELKATMLRLQSVLEGVNHAKSIA